MGVWDLSTFSEAQQFFESQIYSLIEYSSPPIPPPPHLPCKLHSAWVEEGGGGGGDSTHSCTPLLLKLK